MAWLLYILAIAAFIGGGVWLFCVRFSDYKGTWQRFVAKGLTLSGPVVALWASTFFNLFVFTFALVAVWAGCAASWWLGNHKRSENKNREKVEEDGFKKQRLKNLSTRSDRSDARKGNKKYKKELRERRKHSVVPGAMLAALALMSIAIGVYGLWLRHAQPDFNPMPWKAWIGVVAIASIAVALQLLPKKWWISAIGIVAAATAAFCLILPVFAESKEKAEDSYQSAAELEAEQKPPADEETDWIPRECPSDFILTDKDQDGIVDQDTLDAARASGEDYHYYRATKDVDFLIEKAVDAEIWEPDQYTAEQLTEQIEVDATTGNTILCLDDEAWEALAELYPEKWGPTVDAALEAKPIEDEPTDN